MLGGMTVTTRRERRQQQRRQQQRRASTSGGGGGGTRGSRQLWIALAVVAGIAVLILVGRAAGVFNPPASQTGVLGVDSSGPTVGTHMPDIGNPHIPVGQSANYPSLPPTSGPHWSQSGVAPAPWGVKTAFLPFEVTVHNLEHGGIVILYNGLSTEETQQLESTVRTLTANGLPKIVLEPWPALKDAKIDLTAWNWILKLQSYDQTQVVKFVRQHYEGEAPENSTP